MKRYKMRGVGKGVFGYTIVEALIFLAVSGLLLVSVAGLISGRQERTMFANAVNDVQQDLLDMFNDVNSGYYPSDGKVGCNVSGGAVSLSPSGGQESGANSGCMFIGKVIEFSPPSTSFTAYTMVAPSTMEGTLLSPGNLSKIKLAGKGSQAGIADTKSNNLDLRVTKITSGSGASEQTFKSLIVVSDLGIGGSTNNFSGNANKLTLYGSEDGTLVAGKVSKIDQDVTLCLKQSGDNGKEAYLVLTPQLTIERTIGSRGPSCDA